jgi:hypothetical protein
MFALDGGSKYIAIAPIAQPEPFTKFHSGHGEVTHSHVGLINICQSLFHLALIER